MSDTYGRKRLLEGRNYMDHSDIDTTKPNALKQNRITNIPSYNSQTKDIDQPKKFASNRTTDPLDPSYFIESKSRRNIIQVGQIEGSKPKPT